MILRNRVNRKLLKHQVMSSLTPRITLSFYKYFQVSDPHSFRDQLYQDFSKFHVLGRVYVATEGVNAQISVPVEQFGSFKMHLLTYSDLQGIRLNQAVEDSSSSFFKLKILVREKIVADGLSADVLDFTHKVGSVDAKKFNELADRSDTVIVDMRNHYESEVGHFKNAVCPDVSTFREGLQVITKLLKHNKEEHILLYCTGGIRCEKAGVWLKHLGFKHVYQLDGGIIEYAHQVRKNKLENKFRGKNFVFDERLGERISSEVISVCHQCGKPCDHHVNCKNDACHLLFIQCSECAHNMDNCCSQDCKSIIKLSIEAQKKIRKEVSNNRNVFHKGRSPHILYKTVPKKTSNMCSVTY